MRREAIIANLKGYQRMEGDPAVREYLRDCFLEGINRRVREHHGGRAKCAVRVVLETMGKTPAYPALCLDAMLQLCRDCALEYSLWQDGDLVSRIVAGNYFPSPPALDLYVETQDGVV